MRYDVFMPPSCPLCSSISSLAFSKFGDEYFRCSCGFVFIWPRPSEGELRELYRKHGEEYWTSERMLEFTLSPTKSCREIDFVRRFATSGTLLDIGCSTGSFVKAARDSGFDAEGVDISVPAVECGRRHGLPLQAMDILNESTGKDYDIVTLWAILEHLPDPMRHLARTRELLKPEGILFVSVPNYAGINQKVIGKWDRYVGKDHLNYFKPTVLRHSLSKAGFAPKATVTWGFNPFETLRDIRNIGRHVLTDENMVSDSALTLSIKESSLSHIQRTFERFLNLFALANAVAVCATPSPRCSN